MDEVLVIANGMIGDVILTTGVIAEIARRHADARLTIVCSPTTALLFRDMPGRPDVIPLTKQRRGGHWLALYRRLGARRWTAVYDFRGTLFARFLRGPKMRPRRDRSEVRAHKVTEAATILGKGARAISPSLWMTDAHGADLPALVREAQGPVLALGPGASRIGKAWPLARFIDLTRRLAEAGGRLEGALVIVVGGPMDRAAAKAISAGLPGSVVDLTGADLLLTAAALRRADLFVGNDSGMMHLAAAAGARTLGLFGPTDERLYAPWGPHAASVRAEAVPVVFGKTSRTVSTDHSQMEALQVEAALAAAERLLDA